MKRDADSSTSVYRRVMRLARGTLGAMCLTVSGAGFAQTKPVTIFIGPTPLYDSIWMADKHNLYKTEGLDVDLRIFPSGSTALQTFKAVRLANTSGSTFVSRKRKRSGSRKNAM